MGEPCRKELRKKVDTNLFFIQTKLIGNLQFGSTDFGLRFAGKNDQGERFTVGVKRGQKPYSLLNKKLIKIQLGQRTLKNIWMKGLFSLDKQHQVYDNASSDYYSVLYLDNKPVCKK